MSSQRPWQPWFARLLCLLCWAGWLCLPQSVLAQDRILEKAYWSDTSGTASFEQAREAHYTPYNGVLSKGFTPHVQWIRLTIDAVPKGGPDTLVLRIRPVFLDEITLFDPANLAQGAAERQTGDATPVQSTEFESLNHTFVIPTLQEKREVWLRLSTTSTQLMHVEALFPRDMLRDEHKLWLFYSALLAVLFSSLVWVLMAWLQDREVVNGIFVLRQTILLLYTASYLGYHRLLLGDLLTPISHNIAYNWLVLLTTGLSFAFEYRLLSEYTLPRWAHWMLRGLLTASAVAMMLLIFGLTREALNLNMLLNGVGLLTMLCVSSQIKSTTQSELSTASYRLPKSSLVLYYLSSIAILALSVLPSLGLFSGSLLSLYGILFYGLISGGFMTALLILRSRRLAYLRAEEANHLFLSRQQLAVEQQRRQDQTQLLSMLMHELKTPLAIIDMAVSTRTHDGRTAGYVGRAVNTIKGILDRCIQTDRLVEREFKLQMGTVHLSEQLAQWLQDRHEAEQRIVSDIAPNLVLTSDLQCLQIMANNLIDNALRHGDPQAPVWVSLQSAQSADGRFGILLAVRNVPGPSGRPDPEQIFAKYYRSSGAQRQSGTGLGLFLSHNLAAQMGGELRYTPDPDDIQFELWLPT